MVLLNKGNFVGNPFKTRDDVEKACIALLDPLAQHTSPGGALISIGSTATHYDLKAVAFETFARPLWGLTSLLAGGGDYEGAERWFKGLASGTDPKSPEYWGAAKAKDQRMVEMSPLSYAIAMAPERFYNNQTEEVKKNIAAFLDSCNSRPMPDTNWLWFRVFANTALRTIGSSLFNPEQMSKDLDRLDSFQLPPNEATGTAAASAGWSRDGPEGVMQVDYYSGSFAIQFSQLVYSKLAEDTDPARAKTYRERAQSFIQDFIYYFSSSGSAIPFGRSMVYRFAVISTFSALPLVDLEPPAPLTWGHVKGLVLRHLRSWNGNVDIFRSDGTLNIGYGYDNMNMTENYNAPGSPYWCMKAFACLGAPSSHPFWTSTEQPWPSDLLPPVKALPDPGHIMCRLGGHTFLLSSGQSAHYALRHASEKYGKFAYSSAFGFSCSTGDLDLEQLAADSMLALHDASPEVASADGETWRVRRVPLNARIVGRGTPDVHLRSGWRPWADIEVETFLIPPQESSPNWYLRVHKITSTKGRPLKTAEAGWAIYGQGEDGRALVQAFSGEKSRGGDEELGWARAKTAGGVVGIKDIPLINLENGGERHGKLVQSDPNSNIIFSRSVLPSLLGKACEGGQTTWIATAVFGVPALDTSGNLPAGWEKEWDRLPEVPKYVYES